MDAVTDKLRTTFVPEDPDGAQRRTVADQPVVIYTPCQRAAGLTFVITAVSMPISKYMSIIEALLAANHVVVGVYVTITQGHRAKAERVSRAFDELSVEYRVKKYGIVGHSIGGKIALLTAALYDEERRITSVVALDPVDQSPPEFTNPAQLTSAKKGRDNLSLRSLEADLTLTCTESGYWIKKAHNARAIQTHAPAAKLIMHRNVPHMVYCDDDGVLSWKALTGKGKSPDRNAAVKAEAVALVREKARARPALPALARGTSGKAGKVASAFGKAKKAVRDNLDELKELGGDAQKKGNAFARTANLAKATM